MPYITQKDVANFLLRYWDDEECVSASFYMQHLSPEEKKKIAWKDDWSDSLKSQVGGGFTWSSTPQKKDFWSKISKRASKLRRDGQIT